MENLKTKEAKLAETQRKRAEIRADGLLYTYQQMSYEDRWEYAVNETLAGKNPVPDWGNNGR